MDNYSDLIDENLSKYTNSCYPEIIYESINYSLMSGGKRIRPKLVLASCEAVGGNINSAMPFACAIEMIHAYSLIHDDLPSIDNDDFRRGKKTNHKVYGEGMATLAGDALLNMAYEVMSLECLKNLKKAQILAMQEIATSAGVKGMIGGQVADITSESKIITSDELMYIHTHKTGALIQSCMYAGSILGGADESLANKLKEAGKLIGIAFQIKDDLLDIQSTNEVLGKPINSDIKNNKVTYVTLHGIEKSQDDFENYTKKAIQILNNENLKNDYMQKLAISLLKRIN